MISWMLYEGVKSNDQRAARTCCDRTDSCVSLAFAVMLSVVELMSPLR